jgi:hypothetical protein
VYLTRASERAKDMINAEAWAEVFKDVLYLVPEEIRASVLTLVAQNEEARRKEAEWLRASAINEIGMDAPGLRHWDAIARLRSLVIQVLVRRVKNNNSPEDAAKILFAEHPYGHGSGRLGDYLDGLSWIRDRRASSR